MASSEDRSLISTECLASAIIVASSTNTPASTPEFGIRWAKKARRSIATDGCGTARETSGSLPSKYQAGWPAATSGVIRRQASRSNANVLPMSRPGPRHARTTTTGASAVATRKSSTWIASRCTAPMARLSRSFVRVAAPGEGLRPTSPAAKPLGGCLTASNATLDAKCPTIAQSSIWTGTTSSALSSLQ